MNNTKAIINLFAIVAVVLGVSLLSNPEQATGQVVVGQAFKTVAFAKSDVSKADLENTLQYQLENTELDVYTKDFDRVGVIYKTREAYPPVLPIPSTIRTSDGREIVIDELAYGVITRTENFVVLGSR